MKKTAQSSRTRPSAGRLRIQTTYLVWVCVLCICLGGCEKADSRVPDPELADIAGSLPTKPWPASDKDLCEALPSGPAGVLTIQEIVEDRSLTLALRYNHLKTEKLPERYSLKSLHIQTQPKQIGWHARLEEEIETWEGLVKVSADPEQKSSITVGSPSSNQEKRTSELEAFQDVIAMALGCLNTLEKWCGSNPNAEANTPFTILLPNSKAVTLQIGSPRSIRAQVGEIGFSVTASDQGIQWIGTTPNSSTGKVIIFRLPVIPPTS